MRTCLKSAMSRDPAQWGPRLWYVIHMVCDTYPQVPSESHRVSTIEFFRSLRMLIPCPQCVSHYCKYLDENPVEDHVHSGRALLIYCNRLHNHINKALGKREVTLHVREPDGRIIAIR